MDENLTTAESQRVKVRKKTTVILASLLPAILISLPISVDYATTGAIGSFLSVFDWNLAYISVLLLTDLAIASINALLFWNKEYLPKIWIILIPLGGSMGVFVSTFVLRFALVAGIFLLIAVFSPGNK